MNQTANTANEVGEGESGQGPGRRLRKAREAKGLIPGAIAQELRVDTKVIDALERDDYAQLPMPVFVRGYLRGYARLVGVPAEPLVAAYDRRTGHEPPPLVVRPTVKTELRSSDRHVRWVTYLIVVALLALVALWWRNEADLRFWEVATHAPADTEAPVPIAAPAAIPLAGEGEVAVLQPLPELSSPLPDTAVDLPMPVAPTAAAASGDDAATATPATGAAQAPAEGTAPAPGETPVAPATAALVLEFSAACWVDVRAADGEKLLYGMIGAGERHALDGKTPFTLVLGNAPGVRIQFRGEAFDAGRYTAGNVARFTLGE